MEKNLKQVVVEKKTPLSLREREKLLEAIDNGICEAAVAFTHAKGLSPTVLSRRARANLIEFKSKLTVSREETKQARVQRDESRMIVDQLKLERELREQFVVALSHDLKTPLTAAKLSAGLIIRKAEDSKSHVLLAAQIVRNLDRVDRMIVDILDANRINSGEKITLNFEEFDLNKLVTQTLLELGTIYGDRFKTLFENETKGFWSKDGLRRIVENLAINAIKYGDPQAPILVSIRNENQEISLSVHNEGNPLTLQDQTTLFKHYVRIHSERSRGKPGWGLGLALVRGITEAHGEDIRVTSSQEKGTTFTLKLSRDSRPIQSLKT